MKLIVGLGNPGNEYAKTRHNIGFQILDAMHTHWTYNKKANALIHKEKDALFVKPQTFINQSGRAIGVLKKIYRVTPKNIWIIHDDSDLVVGRIKITRGGSAAGHKGVQSIYDILTTQTCVRFKIGVRPFGVRSRAENFVLQPFRSNEHETIQQVIDVSIQAIRTAQKVNIVQAMNSYNGIQNS
ncbi:MAG: aminoacyl-tRNA hydrolase [Candidatus Kerfeldbacteria bacterium RIFCSPHIGHO2_02_FULL_42_14]|uniref:Peptidyl-tRNA hydrolase n=1 Tax=Candidatus Kerfeldbacteria bacterium RIFCSPHIGHO2_02_FULL_42_14 TaxID=1798540 RepID=A0A1G2ATI3_9BACT|nr:MAG: aminoacyl-tRNA hydrolase [Candidatus Kerfeldbacteria bacterium RIFCSPHIGHO2_02_FULL_42_14]OGY81266.1 MAG: aminoacyl-tRNA hydrolase [Candidatus Kerfeldbacteria bacterium RIFCSPHIGHO2_12_FULL_42_13]OGY83541.1 MAG: aminoacyl-tRNA hydrolase [Candidatus Kerfeldbacteria bacterium RIFCSPLOWO2_02_FULL_42_19]OGY85784.1 MAG: aminoacyl-tRNA hydrolase [Candidatus Kerfeldbacteria bacterium RIFCSPLOWO2_12_FULL_43_9]